MAFDAVAAIVSAAAEAAPVMETVGEVGMAVSAVGVVTGNQDMVKIGGVMGMASLADAGLASLDNVGQSALETANAGATGAADSGAATAAGGGIDASTAAQEAGTPDLSTATQGVNATSGGPTGGASFSDAGFAAGNPTGTATPGVNAASANPTGVASSGANMPPLTTNTVGVNATSGGPTGGASFSDAGFASDKPYMQYGLGTAPQDPDTFLSKFDALGTWMENHKVMSAGLISIGGGIAKGIQQQNQFNQMYGLQNQALQNRSNTTSSSGIITSTRGS